MNILCKCIIIKIRYYYMCLLLFITIAVLHNTYTCMHTYYKFGYALLTVNGITMDCSVFTDQPAM